MSLIATQCGHPGKCCWQVHTYYAAGKMIGSYTAEVNLASRGQEVRAWMSRWNTFLNVLARSSRITAFQLVTVTRINGV